ncbi:MAG TPA: helix-turn-helix domain-containing protein [Prolixibacteraceae bacterium]
MTKIENERQHKATMERIEELLPLVTADTPLTYRNLVELELLSNLVADYDEVHFPINAPSLPEVLKLKMYERDLTQTMLAEIIGVSPSRISEYLTGKSEPTLKIARLICVKLDISPNTVLGI